jgi:hypothetical protein
MNGKVMDNTGFRSPDKHALQVVLSGGASFPQFGDPGLRLAEIFQQLGEEILV